MGIHTTLMQPVNETRREKSCFSNHQKARCQQKKSSNPKHCIKQIRPNKEHVLEHREKQKGVKSTSVASAIAPDPALYLRQYTNYGSSN